MTTYTHARHDSLSERILSGAAHILERGAARVAHYRVYSNSLAELRKLSDRDLEDLGMHRAMLKTVALQAADQQVALRK